MKTSRAYRAVRNLSNKASREDPVRKFQDLLETRQFLGRGDDGFDLRQAVLSARQEEWNIGLTRKSLTRAWGANLPNIFPKLNAASEWSSLLCRQHLIHGSLHQDVENAPHTEDAVHKVRSGDRVVLFEVGFLASTHSWLEANLTKDLRMACLGFVYDDMAHYFMSDYPNRLTQKLNSDFELSVSERAEAQRLMQKLVERKISKYNSQPVFTPDLHQGYKRRVLVCDQSRNDASVLYGRIDAEGFEEMLRAALEENPDAEIIVKTHPDVHWGKGRRQGFFDHLREEGRVKVLRKPINPHCLFELVDKVYVGTSQMGLEALFAGKQVVCFGAPFYSGWGLTDDRQVVSCRHRQRTLEDVFYLSYLWYTIFCVPGINGPATLDQVIDYVTAHAGLS